MKKTLFSTLLSLSLAAALTLPALSADAGAPQAPGDARRTPRRRRPSVGRR